jgi:phospholipase/carboxylesterase
MVGLLLSFAGCAGRQVVTKAPAAPCSSEKGPVAALLSDLVPLEPQWGSDRSDDEVTQLQVRFGEAEGLRYLEVVVGRVDVDSPLPMVLGIHGLGDQPRVPTYARIGEDLPYRFIMPWAPDAWGSSGFTWLPVRVRDNKTDVLSQSLEEKAAWLARFLRTLTRERPTVGRAVVTGGSQGGMLVFAMAVHHPDVVGAALPVMGWLPPPLVPPSVDTPEAYPRIRSVHGTRDPYVPIEPTRDSVRALQRLGLDVQLEEYEGVGHHMTDAMDAQVGEWIQTMVEAQRRTVEGRRPAWEALE